MKADNNFKLSKSTKRILSSIMDKEHRRLFKDMMIRAEVDYAANKKKALSSKKDKEPV